MNIKDFWRAVVEQNPEKLRRFFKETATVSWHNTNEQFTVDEFIRANCEYPGQWDGEVERIEELGDRIITVTRVFSRESSVSVHATSFISVEDGKIASIDEYWGDDGDAPQWRADMRIGRKIK
ncbi:MAG: nuclear transport factor 2 family protein [Peptostreptococcaceae bacterium]|nr:nuclear transport factor 2 family protein [Peptostreptococcaceae bacterium]